MREVFSSSFAHGNFSSRLIALLSTPPVILFMFMMPVAHAQAAVNMPALVELTNQDRAAQGLGLVRENALLDQAAEAKASDMAAKGYFAHTSPDGKTSWTWFQMAGYKYSRAGENLAEGFPDAQSVETAWLNSPSHRENIMNGKYTEVGFGTATGVYQGHEVIFVAEMFGTPQLASASAPAPAIARVATAAYAPVPVAAAAPSSMRVLGAKAPPAAQKPPVPQPKVTRPIVSTTLSADTASAMAVPAVQPRHQWWSRLISYLSDGYARLLALAVKGRFA